jgi:hypothetical protein
MMGAGANINTALLGMGGVDVTHGTINPSGRLINVQGKNCCDCQEGGMINFKELVEPCFICGKPAFSHCGWSNRGLGGEGASQLGSCFAFSHCGKFLCEDHLKVFVKKEDHFST